MFLMGFILVISIFFAALEYTSGDAPMDYDEDLLSKLVHEQEEDLIPLATPKDLLKPAPAKQEQAPDVLNIAETVETIELFDEPGTETKEEEIPATEKKEEKEEEQTTDKTEPPVLNAEDNPLNFRVVEDLPEFPGGAVAFMKWLTKNLQYPHTAQRGRVQGRVVAQFIVNADGTISNLKIKKSLDPACDKEALRVLSMMPAWRAGSHNGKPCRTMVAIPIVFKL